MSDSDSEVFKELLLAKWSDRFIAWLIDFIIISSIFTVIFTSFFGTIDVEWSENMMMSEATSYIPASILFLVYWIVLEYKTGQSIGKKILHLKVVNIDGKPPTILGVMISSFGKSFLLPIDLILGHIFTNQKRQRIFNKIGDTIVLKIKDTENNSEQIKYKKD
ncbi:MAG TPA: RDD family protein [Nitrosopumilaceae archaeon]|nr:RDD family protein [Nitrosopumilaceae archaeon]